MKPLQKLLTAFLFNRIHNMSPRKHITNILQQKTLPTKEIWCHFNFSITCLIESKAINSGFVVCVIYSFVISVTATLVLDIVLKIKNSF